LPNLQIASIRGYGKHHEIVYGLGRSPREILDGTTHLDFLHQSRNQHFLPLEQIRNITHLLRVALAFAMPSAPPASADASTTTKSGITTTADGQRVIPASVRPDGTTRREIRVRPGYRPPEDIEVYKNRTAEAWKSRGSGGIPGAAAASDDEKPTDKGSAAANKNAKRKAARKKAKEKDVDTGKGKEGEAEKGKEKEKEVKNTEGVGESGESRQDQSPSDTTASERKSEPSPEEKEKQAKSIRKKIRQANELKNRKEGGESLLPEQLEKVIKLNELVRQLNALGFDQ
jgi:partner of Y14 and mago